MDLFDKCQSFTLAREAMAAGIYPYFTVLDDNSEGTEVVIRGRKVIMIGSNNYLGLTTDPRVRQAAVEATRKYGTSCTSKPSGGWPGLLAKRPRWYFRPACRPTWARSARWWTRAT